MDGLDSFRRQGGELCEECATLADSSHRQRVIAFIKLLLQLLYPTCLALLLVGAGVIWLFLASGRQPGKLKWGRRFCLAGFLVLLLGSNPRIGRGSLATRQHQHAAVAAQPEILGVDYVVVLGGGVSPRGEDASALSELSGPTLARLAEGIRLHRAEPKSRLLLSGSGSTEKTESSVMKRAAISLGVDPSQIEVEESTMNTAEQALLISERMVGKRYYLVSSAEHMPRVLTAFTEAGANPIPAPTGHETYAEEARLGNLIGMPHSQNLHAVDRVIYELLATPRTKRQVREAQ